MKVRFDGQCRATALVALGLSLALAGCGGGGGGTDSASAGGASTGGAASPSPASGSGPAPTVSPSVVPPGATTPVSSPSTSTPASTPPTPVVVHYAIGAQGSVVPLASSTDFPTLVGMSATADGGYRIVWTMSAFDTPTHLQTSYYEQRYDGMGQRIGDRTLIATPAEDMSGSRSGRVDALGGGSMQIGSLVPDGQHPTLFVQHYAADGTTIDAPVELGGPAIGWSSAMLALPGGAIAITWQSVSHVGPAPLQTAMLTPG